MIQDGVLVEHKNVNYGFVDTSKHLVDVAGTVAGETETYLHEFGKDTMYEDMQVLVTSEVATHALKLQEVLLALHSSYVLPKDIFVISSESYENYTNAVVKTAVEAQYRNAPHTLHTLTQTEIDDLVISQLDITEPLSLNALVLALFVHMERNRTAKNSGELAVY